MTFKTFGSLKKHIKSEHGINISPIPESQDGAKGLDPNKARTPKIKCDRCEFRAETKQILIEHLEEKHTEKEFRCEVCEMNADTIDQLRKHVKLCHDNKTKQSEKLKIKCLCGFKANTKEQLKLHVDEKHTRKEFRCEVCEMKADNLDQLRKHTNYYHMNNKRSNNKEICYFWQQGTCRYDDFTCNFQHSTQTNAPKNAWKL